MASDAEYEVRMSFTFTHYGQAHQIEAIRARLERELYLVLRRPVTVKLTRRKKNADV